MHWLLKDLNPVQLEAVTTTDGPLLVIAGAGSGKTRVLTRRLAYILSQQLAEPHQVLAVTFTNKAAGEMKERVNQLLGGPIYSLNVSTFHSFCARLLRAEAKHIGYEPGFSIFDESDALSLIKRSIKELGIAENQFPAKGQLHKISDQKNLLVGPVEYAQKSKGYFESRTAAIYSLYQKRLRECNAMDFDDLLVNAVLLLKNEEPIGQKYRDRFKYLMVDEYQDTNHVQYLLLKYLLGAHHNLCVVGDEDQSIYGWRGADIRNILDFEKDFPGAKVVKLEQNYRSTMNILKAASAVINHNTARKGKTLWTEGDEGEHLELFLTDSAETEATTIVDQIERSRGSWPLKEMVILYRTNAQSRAFEEQLRRRSLPYAIIGGTQFYQREEIKNVLAYLKLLTNPKDDISFDRIINYPKRGIGDKTLADIADLARRDNVNNYEVAKHSPRYPELAGKSKRIEPFVEVMEKFRERSAVDPVDVLIEDLVAELHLLEEIRREEEPIVAQNRIENIEAFVEGAAGYARANSEAHLAEYLAEISLFTDMQEVARNGENSEKVTLMTLHAAKGLEFDCVFLVGLEEGLFPLGQTLSDPMQLEEERRLFYVGSTRARKKLYLSSATTRFRFGEVESIPSRFIREIPEELLLKRDFRSQRRYEAVNDFAARSAPYYKSTKPAAEKGEVHYDYEEDEIMKVGRIVVHPTFGRGRIVKSEGFGDSLRLEINFTGLGIKKIMAKFARLKVVG